MQQREDGLVGYARLELLGLIPVAPTFGFMST
jgi:hypothetical protein